MPIEFAISVPSCRKSFARNSFASGMLVELVPVVVRVRSVGRTCVPGMEAEAQPKPVWKLDFDVLHKATWLNIERWAQELKGSRRILRRPTAVKLHRKLFLCND